MFKKVTLQPADIFKKLNIQHTPEHEKVLDVSLKLLVYLKNGEKIKVGGITYTKLDGDTVHIGVKVSPSDISEALMSKKSIRIMT